jgi:hypothetical protein
MKLAIGLALGLIGCSSIDPRVGFLRTEQPGPTDEVDAWSGQEPADDGSTDAQPDGDARVERTSGTISFRASIRPLMNRTASDPTGKGCKNCHYSTEASHQGLDLGGLDLATLGALREGGGSTGRRIVVPGKPDESGLIQKLRGTYPYGTRMPKNGPPFWSDADVQLVADWISEGAQGADDE